jgi:hypothetical protein
MSYILRVIYIFTKLFIRALCVSKMDNLSKKARKSGGKWANELAGRFESRVIDAGAVFIWRLPEHHRSQTGAPSHSAPTEAGEDRTKLELALPFPRQPVAMRLLPAV